jgi:tetratricopeptide (TPR) repeat protein
MKLALAIISEGDHPNLKRAVDSAYNVDGIFITTTKLKKPQWEDPKISWSYFPWREDFAAARNFNFSQIPNQFTHVLWIDSDDIVKNAKILPEVVESMDTNNLDAVYVDYNYDINEAGQVNIVHPRERIVRHGIYHWKAKLHETLLPNRKVRNSYIKDFVVDHYPTKENREGGLLRNLKILQKDYEEQRKLMVQGKIQEIDPRTEYYLGRVLYDTRTDTGFKRAFQLFQDYIQHSGWDEEKAFAWNYLGNISYHFGNYDEAINCYLSAIKERPEFPSWHIALARTYCAVKDFDKAYHHIKVGISMEQPNTAMIITPLEDKKNSLTTLFYVWFAKYNFKQAIKAAKMLYELEPTEENYKKLESVEKLQKWTKWSKSLTEMAQDMFDHGEQEKIDALLDNVPQDIRDNAYTTNLRSAYGKPKEWPKNSIVYYAAIDVHEWSPKSLKTGLGGSEEAIYYLSREWVKLGYQVTVYTSVGADEGVYDGVQYLNYQRFNNKDKFDILIAWRNPHFIHKNLLDARLILLDMHDIPEVGEFDPSLLATVDYLMVKSPYHRSLLPTVPDNKFKIISNGIDWNQLKAVNAKKHPHWCFYGSSYDRGLEGLLTIWPEVKKAVPDAELHIAYGWDLFDKLRKHVSSLMAWKGRMVEAMKADGITEHGKLGKKELYNLAKSCGVWAYPTTFQEIDCITARYCQALGTLPIVNNYAALATTVQRGVRLAVDPFKKESLEEYKRALIKSLKDGEKFDVGFAEEWDWYNIAKQWVDVFNEPEPTDTKITVFTPTIRSGFWNLMSHNLSSQTYKNFEWLIVDDYKEDRKVVADKYAKKYGLDIKYMRGKLDRSKYNYALIQADNQAIYNATGKIILWLQDFILIPDWGLERVARLFRRYPNALQAPVDEYRRIVEKPDLTNKEDWFNGELAVVGKFLRQNIRIKQGNIRYTSSPFDFEMNVGAIPTHIARKLNGLWEFQDDGLGFNNTDIAFRALKAGFKIIIDERFRAICLDLWEYLTGHDENAKRREWNLNDARFTYLVNMTNSGRLPLVRDANIDRKIKLTDDMPQDLDQEGAAKWIQANVERLSKGWMK